MITWNNLDTLTSFKDVQGKIAGFVLNDVEGKNDTDHTYGKYGYDYGSRNNE